MRVANFMHRHVTYISPNTPLSEVWELFYKKNIHSVPVVDAQKKLIGLIAGADLLNKLFPGYEDLNDVFSDFKEDEIISDKLQKFKKIKASEVMSTHVLYTRADTMIMRALSRMIAHKVRQLPVLDDDDRIIGMLSKADIFRAVFKKRKR